MVAEHLKTSILFLIVMIVMTKPFNIHAEVAMTKPFQIHPENPHYFLFRDKPTLLITSAEHYGAVLNAEFDYATYLDTLSRDALNHTRIFVGAYCEPVGAFKITRNTLAPEAGKFICPWARSDQPGYANGGNKFDLTKWDDRYFERLTDFVSKAAVHGIVVEVNLFCPFYKDEMWDLSPMNNRNNVSDVGDMSRDDVYTLDKSGGLLAVQEAMTRKVVAELKDYDNLYYEVMNEPYVGKVPMVWQERIVDVIVDTQEELGVRHLISLNIANKKEKVETVHDAVSILNFHYTWPPETVAMNYGLNLVIGENETGGKGTGDFHYRREAWAFILAGGGLYNNLDYSFAVGYEDGTFSHPEQPGGGSDKLRAQLKILTEFIHHFDFVHMVPCDVGVGLPEGFAAFALEESGKQYAVYLCSEADAPPSETATVDLQLDLPSGAYRFEWLDTLTGEVKLDGQFDHEDGKRLLASPSFIADIALRVVSDTKN